MAIFVDVALFQRVAVPCACQCLFDEFFIRVDVAGVGEILETHGQQFVVGVADHPAKGLVHPQQPAVQCHVRDAGGIVFEGFEKTLLADAGQRAGFPQMLVSLLHEPDGAHDDQLGQQVPEVEPEGFARVVEGERQVGFDEEKIDQHHAQQGAEHARGESAV
ncbi:hypothetical protein D9M69_506530 [compost metagenome]